MEFLACCKDIARAVEDIVEDMVSRPEGSEVVRTGASGAPYPANRPGGRGLDRRIHHLLLPLQDPCLRGVREEGHRGGEGDHLPRPRGRDPQRPCGNSLLCPLPRICRGRGGAAGLRPGSCPPRDIYCGAGEGGVPGRSAHPGLPHSPPRGECHVRLWPEVQPRPRPLPGAEIRRWRLLGASALELCYVGSGRLDGFIDLRATLRVTDAAAGMLVCEEAGGKVSDLDGKRIRFPDEVTVGKCLVASNGTLHGKVIEYLR